MLTVRGLARLALGPADVDLASGQCIAVTGPSGAGKTLLLRAIADLDPADGEVLLDGVSRNSMPAPDWRAKVTYVPAEAGWWDETVAPHFRAWREALPLIERFLLPTGCGDWPITRLSTGERQRLALARALVQSPHVLLLDEPTSGLDPDATVAVETELRAQLAGGVGILMVTHDAAQADRLAQARLRIDNGRVTGV